VRLWLTILVVALVLLCLLGRMWMRRKIYVKFIAGVPRPKRT